MEGQYLLGYHYDQLRRIPGAILQSDRVTEGRKGLDLRLLRGNICPHLDFADEAVILALCSKKKTRLCDPGILAHSCEAVNITARCGCCAARYTLLRREGGGSLVLNARRTIRGVQGGGKNCKDALLHLEDLVSCTVNTVAHGVALNIVRSRGIAIYRQPKGKEPLEGWVIDTETRKPSERRDIHRSTLLISSSVPALSSQWMCTLSLCAVSKHLPGM